MSIVICSSYVVVLVLQHISFLSLPSGPWPLPPLRFDERPPSPDSALLRAAGLVDALRGVLPLASGLVHLAHGLGDVV